MDNAELLDTTVLDADVAAFNVDPMNGPQVELLNIPSYQPVQTAEQAEALLSRWAEMPAYLDQAAALGRQTGAHRVSCGSEDGHQAIASRLDHLPARRGHLERRDRDVEV